MNIKGGMYMATILYILLVFFTPMQFNFFWFFVSVLFSLVETGGRIIYRYTTDKSLAGHMEEL